MISIKTLKFNTDNSKLILISLSVLFVIMFASYSYLVNLGVVNVVERNNIEEAIVLAESRVSELESEYFERISSINIQDALAYGLSESKSVQYASRKSLERKVISLNSAR